MIKRIKKECLLQLRISQEEKKELKMLSEQYGVTQSHLVRLALKELKIRYAD